MTMIIRTLQPLKGLNHRGEIVKVPPGTYLSVDPDKANLLISLDLAKPERIFEWEARDEPLGKFPVHDRYVN